MHAAAQQFEELIELKTAPVAVTFCETAPEDVPAWEGVAPSGCSYWLEAADGNTFYTEASHHSGCPVGAHVMGIELTETQQGELQELVGTMIDLAYLKSEEVPGIPQRTEPFACAVYAPLASAPVDPDVVILRGSARQVMLVGEAARAASVEVGAVMGRPTCAAIPEVLRTGHAVTNLGCIGNRVYNSLDDEELYVVLPGARIGEIAEALAATVRANRELETFHRARL